jgi:hypothetical protein
MWSGRLLTPPASMSKPNLLAMRTLSRMGASALQLVLRWYTGPVHFGGIEERDAFFMGCTNDVYALDSVCRRPVVGADAHAPRAHFRDFKCSQSSRLHFVLLRDRALLSPRLVMSLDCSEHAANHNGPSASPAPIRAAFANTSRRRRPERSRVIDAATSSRLGIDVSGGRYCRAVVSGR